MRARLVAGGVGVLLVIAAALAFTETRHPEVAGTNTVAPYEPAWSIPGESTRCQTLRRVPGGANRVRMSLSTAPDAGPIQAAIVRNSVPVAQGAIRPKLGTVNFKLGRQTPAINRAKLCISNLGKQRAVFLGEHKRTRKHPGARARRPVPSVTFVKRGSSSWLGRAETIIRRFGYAQAGALGGWALWLAAAFAVAMFALALWAAIRQPEPRAAVADHPRDRVRGALARIPTVGWICAAVALLSALTWSLIVPLFQVPDEQAHVAYAQHFAEFGAPPAGHRNVPPMSEEERRLLARLHWRQITHRPGNPPPVRTPRAHRLLEEAVDRPADRAGSGGFNNATQNPPLYYGIAAIAYRLSPATTLPDRVHAMRFVSALLAALTALLAFLFMREVLPSAPWAWTIGGLAVALQPMLGFIGGGVNNDNLLFAASAGALLSLAICFRRGLTLKRGVVLGAFMAAGLLAKVTMIGLAPGIALGLVLLIVRAPAEQRHDALRAAGAAVAVAVLPFLVYMGLNSVAWDRAVLFGSPQAGGQQTVTAAFNAHPSTLVGHLSYLWQFYLPRLQIMSGWFPTYEAREIWFEGFIGRFGWLDYGFPGWVYDFGLVASVALLALATREVVSRLDAIRGRLAELITYLAVVVGLLGLLGWIAYDWRRGHPGQFEQARYILPLLAFYGGLIAIAARGGGRRWGPVIGVLIVSIALAQSVLAMLITLTRYYG